MEPGKRRFQIFLKSQAGPIECWLIPQPSEDQRYEEVPPAPAEPLPAVLSLSLSSFSFCLPSVRNECRISFL